MSHEVDRLVAEKVMGWKLSYTVGYPEPHTYGYKDKDGNTHKNFKPSTNIEDAWTALDKVCNTHDWRAIIDRSQERTEVMFKTQMGSNISCYGQSESPAMAICKAVLESVGIELNIY